MNSNWINPSLFTLEYIPLDVYGCYIFSLNCKFFIIDQEEYSLIFNYFNKLKYHIIIIDYLIFNYDSIITLDVISKLVDEDILVITFKVDY